jgi:hypothetical protein
MSPDQGQTEFVDLLEEELEALVLCDPLADLGKEFLGNVDGAGLALVFAGEVMGAMGWSAVVAAAAVSSATAGDGDEGCGEDGGGDGQFFQACVEHASDQGWVLWDAHGVLEKASRVNR